MPLWQFIKDEMAVARHVGAQRFDDAIALMTKNLKGTADDIENLAMIAQCHAWAGRDDEAIETSKRALGLDPGHFESHALLSEIYARSEMHHDAARHARQALENYPEPLESQPEFMIGVTRWLCRLIPRLRRHWPEMEKTLRTPDRPNRRWFKWAIEYLEEYDRQMGTSMRPPLQ